MSQHEKLYDLIVLGTGENGKAAIASLEEQGKKVLYIDLETNLIASMSVQVPYENTSDEITDHQQPFKILAHTQTLNTSTYELKTYIFQSKASEESQAEVAATEEDEAFAFTEDGETQIIEEIDAEIEEVKETLEECHEEDVETIEVDEEDIELEEAVETVEEQEELHRESEYIEVVAEEETEEIEGMESECEEDGFSIQTETETENQKEWEVQSLSSKEQSLEQPEANDTSLNAMEERGLSLRKKLLRRKYQSDLNHNSTSLIQPLNSKPENQMDEKVELSAPGTEETAQTLEISMQKPVETDQSDHSFDSPIDSIYDRELKLRKKLLGRNRHSLTNPERTSQQKNDTEETKETIVKKSVSLLDTYKPSTVRQAEELSETLSFEPFTPRRRSRAKKKNRLFANIVSRPAQARKRPSPSSATTPYNDITSSVHTNHMPMQDETYEINDSYYTPSSHNSNPAHTLKADTIEFEDAYGYNQWEDFFTPFSHSSRKRQEMNKIEKRKIALRGLHNLINNLG
ncbi:hypothetical protein [Thermoflavimicrobium dichotomicum]|uniref:Uncharacterized protein n=1 Tax=Thermoflavimicrobium dichotomicum TaxID=46223 RepID=A0A1I3KD50_9BACL|nr:hypothetical protein [Thermoflavimicrobium dichotomicum]SFI70412.1 hypothetical protein SAMN05421852_101416 [Thermoflavimicrobium dichotomicum]